MPFEIIAEVAQGYEGDATLARLLARGAVGAGADAVKFQLVYADELATPDYRWYNLFRSLEMPYEAWRVVVKETHANGVKFYFDVYGEQSLREAVALGADGVKIHTTDFFNASLVRAVLDSMPRVFISVGGISLQELEEFIESYGISPDQDVYFMYGFQAEPTPIQSNNLLRLKSLGQRFRGYRFGFMDHSTGDSDDAVSLALLALPFGIHCIEKHISLDRLLELEDYVSALAPEQFQLFIKRIKHLEQALGTDSLEVTPTELDYRQKALKVVVAAQALAAGHEVVVSDLSLRRTSHPVSPSSLHRIDQVAGRKVTVAVQPNQPITIEMLK